MNAHQATFKPFCQVLLGCRLPGRALILVGGRGISEFARMERVLAETELVGQAMFFGGLGAITRHVADGFEESGENGSLMSDGNSVRT